MKRIVSPAPALPCAALRSGKKNAKRLYFSLGILSSSPFKIAVPYLFGLRYRPP